MNGRTRAPFKSSSPGSWCRVLLRPLFSAIVVIPSRSSSEKTILLRILQGNKPSQCPSGFYFPRPPQLIPPPLSLGCSFRIKIPQAKPRPLMLPFPHRPLRPGFFESPHSNKDSPPPLVIYSGVFFPPLLRPLSTTPFPLWSTSSV